MTVPPDARVIELRGKFLTPGFVNTNIHLTPYFALEDFAGPDSLLVQGALDGMRTLLAHGVLTARDSYGILPVLVAARRAAQGSAEPYPRLLLAGNILGWGGPWSYSFAGSGSEGPANPYQRGLRTAIVQGMGEGLVDLAPDSLRLLLSAYLTRGPDFIKLGVTTHLARPSFLLFGPRALAALVEEAHAGGRRVDAHAESVEGLRLAVEAGVDLLQHPETAGGARLPDDLLREIRERGVTCSIIPEGVTGAEWQAFAAHLARGGRMWPAEGPPSYMEAVADSLRRIGVDPAARPRAPSVEWFRNRRANAEALIRTGCRVTVATDDVIGLPGRPLGRFGTTFAPAVIGLVELGMSSMEALIAATRNGAIAAGLEDRIGTVERGKLADLLVFGADPLADIANIRTLELVIRGGVPVTVPR